MLLTADKLDPGVFVYTKNRRILSMLQLRSEHLFHREGTDRTDVNIVLSNTGTPPSEQLSLRNVIDLHTSQGFKEMQFHYLILGNGDVYTGLDLRDDSVVDKGSVVIGMVGGLSNDGDKLTSLSSYNPKQIESLIGLVGSFATNFEDVALNHILVGQSGPGFGTVFIDYKEILQRSIKRHVTRG